MLETIRDYCLSKAFSDEAMPFDETTLVFRVHKKMFALIGIDNKPLRINLKCHPDKVDGLRERYDAILPGYHMNKKHWNTVVIDGSLSFDFVKSLIDDSYNLVYDSLPKKLKNMYNNIKK